MFDIATIHMLPVEPNAAAIRFTRLALDTIHKSPPGADQYRNTLDAFALFLALNKKYNWDIDTSNVDVTGSQDDVVAAIVKLLVAVNGRFDRLESADFFEEKLVEYEKEVGTGFYYELTDGDLEKIQGLINRLRTAIKACTELEEDHKTRLLKRVECVQGELHKKMSNYDKVYGLAVDGIVLMERFGESLKPVTELIREITKLSWLSQARREELPGDVPPPMLPGPEE